MAEKAKAGIAPGCAPVGYKNVGGGIVRDDRMAPLIAEAFALAACEMSLEKILAELTPKGLKSRNGKTMGRSALRLILTNPFYIGKLRFKDELLDGIHEPLVSEAVFKGANTSLSSRRKSAGVNDVSVSH